MCVGLSLILMLNQASFYIRRWLAALLRTSEMHQCLPPAPVWGVRHLYLLCRKLQCSLLHGGLPSLPHQVKLPRPRRVFIVQGSKSCHKRFVKASHGINSNDECTGVSGWEHCIYEFNAFISSALVKSLFLQQCAPVQ